ncbi:hypothetical protein DFJ73DRAFT_779737 [Zopfochytrium polystomum]|nr:hypothetical protein DFJ73DRAFT_779737 [Zopfochytrium polystomum]
MNSPVGPYTHRFREISSGQDGAGESICRAAAVASVARRATDVNVLIDDGAPVQLSLRDTVNGGIAPLASRETVDAALLCFSIASPESLRSVRERWAEEAEYWYGRRVRIIVVGCQRDLRDDAATVAALDAGGEGSEARTVTYDEGAAVAESIEADAYVECASNRSDDVGKALLEIARAII